MSLIQTKKFGLNGGYCQECKACGTLACCGPEMCKMNFSSSHCKMYLWDLQKTYKEYDAILKYLYDNFDRFPGLQKDVENIRDEFDYVEFEDDELNKSS